MKFLLRHVEKLILGLVLLGLLASAYYLLMSLRQTRETVAEVQKAVTMVSQGDQPLEPLRDDAFNPATELVSPSIRLQVAKEEESGSLVEPQKYIRCANRECSYLLPFDTEICPYCGEEQPEVEPTVTKGEDADEDGIPDYVETQYRFLNPDNPQDAFQDYDRDGFTNLEEYEQKTELDDPKSFPSLAVKLRYMQIYRKAIPIMFSDLARNNPDEPESWDATVRIITGGRRRSAIVRIGDKAGDYRIADIRYDEQEDRAELVVKPADAEDGESVVIPQGEMAREKGYVVRLMYLTNRTDPRRTYRFEVRKGEPFVLPGPRTREQYEVVELSRNPETVRVRQIRREPQAESTVFDVDRLNLQRDFYRANRRGGGEIPGPGGRYPQP